MLTENPWTRAGRRDPWQVWAQEATGTNRELPAIRKVLLLFAVVALVLVFAHGLVEVGPAGADQQQPERSLCEEHAGRPGWTAVCE